jgi:hypothetical protein
MLIDCDTCTGRGVHCDDCVISVLLNAPPRHVELDGDERVAFVSLADAGLVPPLRLITGHAGGGAGDTRGIA